MVDMSNKREKMKEKIRPFFGSKHKVIDMPKSVSSKIEFEDRIKVGLNAISPEPNETKHNRFLLDERERIRNIVTSLAYDEIQNVVEEKDVLSETNRSLQSDLNFKSIEHSDLKWRQQRLEADRQRWESDLKQKYQDDFNEKERRLTQQNDQLRGFHDAELEQVKDKAKEEKVRIRNERNDKIEALDRYHTQETWNLTQRYDNIINDLKNQLDTTKTEAAEDQRQAAQEHDQAIHELKQSNESKIAQLMDSHKKRSEGMVLKHKYQTKQLQSDLQGLNAALLAGDHEAFQGSPFTAPNLPRKPDDKIRDSFQEVRQLVDELARLQWRPDQTMLTDEDLNRLDHNHNQRSLRKAILQDTIWMVLFHGVFSSPFRMFGGVGELLEKEWNEQCGKGHTSEDSTYCWPAPGVKAERWRYMTIKECREALTKPVPSHLDPRAAVKKGYKESQERLISELKEVLEGIVVLTPTDLQGIDRLVRKTLLMWLDFELHRCRLLIGLTGPKTKSTAEKVSLILNGGSKLTISPSVSRYGNVDGIELDDFIVVVDGDSLELS